MCENVFGNRLNLQTISQSVPYEKTLCIICKKIGEQLDKVRTKETRQTMLEVSQKLIDKTMCQRLNSTVNPKDAIAHGVYIITFAGQE